VQLRIADDKTNEVQLKGPNLAKGYLNDDQRFKSKFTGDGWFKTGDVGLIDEEGFLFIKGRLDEMFISGGENIFPNEIENVYAKLTGIKEIGIIGISDQKWGKVPCAFIVPA
ncbi:AMP-binding enzyme, partial [Oenococcus oeni]